MGFIKTAYDSLLSPLFPRSCFVCGSYEGLKNPFSHPDFFLCKECGKGFVLISNREVCSLCGNPLAGNRYGTFCGSCADAKRSFSIARSIVLFSGSAAVAARRFKYGGSFSMASVFSFFVIEFFPADMGNFDVIVPVPLHIKRLREREFNQSALVSSEVALTLGKDHAPFVLERVRETPPQASFSRRKDRKANVTGAFSIKNSEKEKIRNKKVMLFDDIFTTGSTIDECSAALLSGGAEEVKALTVFRTPI